MRPPNAEHTFTTPGWSWELEGSLELLAEDCPVTSKILRNQIDKCCREAYKQGKENFLKSMVNFRQEPDACSDDD